MKDATIERELTFLSGGGEMGQLIRKFDWGNHPLGLPESWPQSLKTTVSIMLSSRFPHLIFWGKDLFCFFNDAMRPSLGNDGTDLAKLGQTAEVASGVIWPTVKGIMDKVMAGEPSSSEDQLVPIYRNGRLENVYWTYCNHPVRDESGGVGGVLVTASDTTKTVLTMVENQRNLDMAMETGGLGAYRITLKTGTANFSTQIVKWFGLDRRVMSTDEFLSGMMAEDRATLAEALQGSATVTKGGRHDLVFRYRNPGTGETSYFRSVGRIVYDAGKAATVTGLFQDITTPVLDQQRLEESELQMRSLVNNSPFPIAMYIGREMRIALANPAILRAWGKGNEVIGKKYSEVLPEMENQQLFQQLDQVFNSGIPFEVKNQFIELQKEGDMVGHYFDYSLTPLFNKSGDVYGVMNTGADVTEINLAHQALDRIAGEMKTRSSY